MYVCLCKVITESQVEKAVKGGCCNEARLRAKLGVGAVCGKCIPMAKEILRGRHEQ